MVLVGDDGVSTATLTEEDFCVFISHLLEDKLLAHDIKDQLAFYGFNGFVAHDDIEPQEIWINKIEEALKTTKALVVIASNYTNRSISSSDWCNQEIGWALGRDIPVITLKNNCNPPGFLSKVQARSINPQRTLGHYIAEVLASLNSQTGDIARTILCSSLFRSTSYDWSHNLFEIIECGVTKSGSCLSQIQVELLKSALQNSQVEYADYGKLKPRIEEMLAANSGSIEG